MPLAAACSLPLQQANDGIELDGQNLTRSLPFLNNPMYAMNQIHQY